MSAILWSLDTATKRWLALLAAVFLLSTGVLVHSFLTASSPQEPITVTAVQRPVPQTAEEVRTRSEPAWGQAQQAGRSEQSAVAERVSPFDAQEAAARKKIDPVARQEAVHQQANYLRNLIAAGKVPSGLGNLTKEQVDQMEKEGVTIQ
jgi:hypothetical protein